MNKTIASAHGAALEICSCHTIVTHSPPFKREVKYVYCMKHLAEIQAARNEFSPPFGSHIKFERGCETLWEAQRKAQELRVDHPGPGYLFDCWIKPLSSGRVLLFAKWIETE